MEHIQFSEEQKAGLWYLVCLRSGATAVVQLEDMVDLLITKKVIFAVHIHDKTGREFEHFRARSAAICPRAVE
jgi:hypothetical protein